MKILILSFYFRPDLSAGSFRVSALVDSFCKLSLPDLQVDVITTLPNRYHSFAADAPVTEHYAGLSIFRIALPKHRSGMLDQARAFLTFSRGVMKHTAKQDYDIVFATSGRLMTAVLGAWISRRKKTRLYLDIRDIFVDTIKDVLPLKISRVAKPFFSLLESWAITRADKVNMVSSGFSEYFSSRYPRQCFSYFTNGIDNEFLIAANTNSFLSPEVPKIKPLTVIYAGNLGEGQGLHTIIPKLAKLMGPRINFKIIGDGGRKKALEAAISKNAVTNVELIPPINRGELIEAYRSADILFLHLNDYDAFKKVLPSKLFEYAAMGKPIWAGISGYSAEFVKSEISNAAVFHPCDEEGAAEVFKTLKIQDIPRANFIAKYSRENISKLMVKDILRLASNETIRAL